MTEIAYKILVSAYNRNKKYNICVPAQLYIKEKIKSGVIKQSKFIKDNEGKGNSFYIITQRDFVKLLSGWWRKKYFVQESIDMVRVLDLFKCIKPSEKKQLWNEMDIISDKIDSWAVSNRKYYRQQMYKLFFTYLVKSPYIKVIKVKRK